MIGGILISHSPHLRICQRQVVYAKQVVNIWLKAPHLSWELMPSSLCLVVGINYSIACHLDLGLKAMNLSHHRRHSIQAML